MVDRINFTSVCAPLLEQMMDFAITHKLSAIETAFLMNSIFEAYEMGCEKTFGNIEDLFKSATFRNEVKNG